jgi:hypothetical protein
MRLSDAAPLLHLHCAAALRLGYPQMLRLHSAAALTRIESAPHQGASRPARMKPSPA